MKEAAHELQGRECHGLPALLAGVLVAEGYGIAVGGKNAVVGDGNPVDVAGEIREGFFRPLNRGLAADDPRGVPHWLWERLIGKGSAGELHEDGAEDFGECAHGNEESLSRRKPRTSVIGKSAARDETVDVGVIDHGPGPGMEYTEHGDGPSDIAGISGEVHEGRGGRSYENGVKNPLMGTDEPMELFGHGEDEMKVWEPVCVGRQRDLVLRAKLFTRSGN